MAIKKLVAGLPTFDGLMRPVVKALISLGGSGTIEEIDGKVAELEKIDEEILKVPHTKDGATTEVEYRLAWARTYLKKCGILNNSERGVWALARPDIDPESIKPNEIVRICRENYLKKVSEIKGKESSDVDVVSEDESQKWKQELLDVLLAISPASFERLAQRMLRESGFIQVEVTGRTGDGGIDGKGIIRISGLLSFHVIFQCKRYKGVVSPSQIRDFRGAMTGRADKGLFITTGSFTREAIKEATRDGAPPIDLIDGEKLCDKLRELKLGINTKLMEEVIINGEWFKSL
ncbi:MAG: restriction endonuclease [Elusimicrobia bacterium HGW-Elusimicrobia-1]|jgi:restriction system protein|nr:MAG: restriction endonuclease [Elusimicrobia bacterium HGW-Elusimicrobia-1]